MLYILKSLEQKSHHLNPLYYTQNVLLLSCNLIELWRWAVDKYDFLSAYTEKIEAFLANASTKFVTKIDNEETLKYLVFQKRLRR